MTYEKNINVLDHGYVKYIDHMGNDLTALSAARMSTGNRTGEDVTKDDRLREYLWNHDHSSPFEMAELVVDIQCPLFVLRQIDRHRTVDYCNDAEDVTTVDDIARKYFSRNEFSGRYAEFTPLYYVPKQERIKAQNKINKQSSGEALNEDKQQWFINNVQALCTNAYNFYEEALREGVAKELARIVLPVNQYTKIRLKGSLLSWMKFLSKRDKPDTMEETREYAIAIASIINDLFPKSYAVCNKKNSMISISNSEYLRLLAKSMP